MWRFAPRPDMALALLHLTTRDTLALPVLLCLDGPSLEQGCIRGHLTSTMQAVWRNCGAHVHTIRILPNLTYAFTLAPAKPQRVRRCRDALFVNGMPRCAFDMSARESNSSHRSQGAVLERACQRLTLPLRGRRIQLPTHETQDYSKVWLLP